MSELINAVFPEIKFEPEPMPFFPSKDCLNIHPTYDFIVNKDLV